MIIRSGLRGLPIPLLLAVIVPAAGFATPKQDTRACSECHPRISRDFATTRMARAAAGGPFRRQWQAQGRPAYCLACHSPTRGTGLVCSDCHGSQGHPYPTVRVPEICARCHDAPGENTIRRFRESPAARQGRDCLDCHLPPDARRTDHRFIGPSKPAFLEGIARIRLAMRREAHGRRVLLVRINHRAGHALPGGTTGRSVWLVVSGRKHDGRPTWQQTFRFGWEHAGDGTWRDRTLPPDRPTVTELPLPAADGTAQVHAELRYRFAPGPLTQPDPREVDLDTAELRLPVGDR